MTDSDEEARVAMPLRVPEGLKTRAEAYAKRRGFSVNTVGILALDAWLTAEEDRLNSPDSAATRGTRSTK